MYLEVCASVNEFALFEVNHESIVSEEVSTEDGLLNISNDEYPGQRPSKTEVKSEGALAVCRYGSIIYCCECEWVG